MSSEGYERQVIQVVDDCDRNRHKLEPRYDSHRVGDVFQKTYVGDVCVRCGHVVPRMLTLKERLEAGLMTSGEAMHGRS